jgi:hypothetical protein
VAPTAFWRIAARAGEVTICAERSALLTGRKAIRSAALQPQIVYTVLAPFMGPEEAPGLLEGSCGQKHELRNVGEGRHTDASGATTVIRHAR